MRRTKEEKFDIALRKLVENLVDGWQCEQRERTGNPMDANTASLRNEIFFFAKRIIAEEYKSYFDYATNKKSRGVGR